MSLGKGLMIAETVAQTDGQTLPIFIYRYAPTWAYLMAGQWSAGEGHTSSPFPPNNAVNASTLVLVITGVLPYIYQLATVMTFMRCLLVQ